jgi:hypothetical protein
MPPATWNMVSVPTHELTAGLLGSTRSNSASAGRAMSGSMSSV